MPQIDPLTGERMPVADIQEWPKPISPKAQAELDAYDGSKDPPIEQPVVSFRPPQIDPETGERIGSSSSITPENAKDAFKATVHAQMLGTTPSDAYLNRDTYDSALRERGGDDYDKGIGHAIETGFEDTPLGLIIRGKAPDPFESHSVLGNFIHDATEMVSDPLMLASAFTSEAGIGIAGFAADAGLRKLLTDQYTKGDVKNFGELADRAGSILWESAKGALLAKAGIAAGGIPVGSMIEKSAFASAAMKGLYQSAVMTTAGSLLNGQLPALQDFERSAALIVPLNLATGGAFLRSGEAKQALVDNYAENGVTPNEASRKLEAQPSSEARSTGRTPPKRFKLAKAWSMAKRASSIPTLPRGRSEPNQSRCRNSKPNLNWLTRFSITQSFTSRASLTRHTSSRKRPSTPAHRMMSFWTATRSSRGVDS